METKMQIFENPEFGSVRSVMIDGEPWLVGKDVATALGYTDTDQAIRRNVDDEDKLTRTFYGSGQNRNMTIINESGVYALIMGSKLPSAKRFKRWVTSEVLPALRKTGSYTMPKVEEPEDEFDTVCRALQIVDKRAKQLEARNTALESRNEALEAQIERDKPLTEFAKAVQASKDCIYVAELATHLTQNGFPVSEYKLFRLLRELKYLKSVKGAEWNKPAQKGKDLGLFWLNETHREVNGKERVFQTTMVTQKGLRYFLDFFCGKN